MEHKVAASIDSLTGIANRRAFLETALRALKQRTRTPQPVSALLFDLDRFKSINDRYGHAVGDRVLRAFADVAAVELRSTDLLGRLGGEEFGALLFGAEASSAAATAERIRRNFASMPLGNGDQLGVSVSIGVASVSASEPTEIESLLTRADEALYVAKARGRNRIEIADAYAGGAVMRIGGDVPAAELPAQNSANAALGVVVSPAISPAQEGDLRPSVVVSGRPLAGNFSAALARDGNDRRR
jgi:diguanylate cyclase (GGDEF)-like protein